MLSSLLTLTLAAAAAATPFRRAAPALKVTVSTPAEVENAINLYAVVELTNIGADTVEINTFDTAFSPLETDDFRIDGSTATGKAQVPYFTGAMAHYVSDPAAVREAGGLLRLATGESKSVNTSLATRYDFTESGSGTYSIGTPAQFSVLAAGATEFETVTATIEPATVNLQGTLVSKRIARKTTKRAEFWLCSAIEQLDIQSAIGEAQTGSVKAAAALPADSVAYTTWFGAYDLARANTVRSAFVNMNGVFDPLTYDCVTCNTPGAYAYVYRELPDTIYVCSLFASVRPGLLAIKLDLAEILNTTAGPVHGPDGKASILVHEVTHWAGMGSTLDRAYGQQASKELAITNPVDAITNADSYRFFWATINP